MVGNSQLNFEISDAPDSLSLFGRGGFRGNGKRGSRAGIEVPSELQASISTLHESEEFSLVSANLEGLRDGLKELRDTVDLPADFPNIHRLHVNISELLDGEDSLVLDELRVSVSELIASGELTDGTELLASIEALGTSVEALRASDEFAQVQATISELIASGDLPADFLDGGFPGGIIHIGGDRDRDGSLDEITGERLGGRFGGRFGGRLGGGDRFDRFDGGIIGELAGDGESLADSEQLRLRIQELIASGDFDGIREGIGRFGGRDRFFNGGLTGGIGDDFGVDTGAILPDPVVVDEGSIVIV